MQARSAFWEKRRLLGPLYGVQLLLLLLPCFPGSAKTMRGEACGRGTRDTPCGAR